MPPKKHISPWMRMNEKPIRHLLTPEDIDAELSPEDQTTADFCRTDYLERVDGVYVPYKCDAFSDANPDLKLRRNTSLKKYEYY